MLSQVRTVCGDQTLTVDVVNAFLRFLWRETTEESEEAHELHADAYARAAAPKEENLVIIKWPSARCR